MFHRTQTLQFCHAPTHAHSLAGMAAAGGEDPMQAYAAVRMGEQLALCSFLGLEDSQTPSA